VTLEGRLVEEYETMAAMRNPQAMAVATVAPTAIGLKRRQVDTH